MKRLLCMVLLVVLALGGGCNDYGVAMPDAGGDVDGRDAGDDGPPPPDGDSPGDADSGPDGSDSFADVGSDPGGCLVPAPQPISITVGEQPCFDCPKNWTGWAQVVFVGEGNTAQSSEVWLLFDDGELVKLVVALPGGRRVPVDLGDRVYAVVKVEMPWWINQEVTLSQESDITIFSFVSRDNYLDDPEFMCPPRQEECGLKGYPLMELAAGKLGQGGTAVFSQGDFSTRIFVGVFHQYLEVQCTDMPMGWLDMATVSNVDSRQCPCYDDADCPPDELCEPSARRCVPNLCPGVVCHEGEVCDPFRGACVEPVAGGCSDNADCGDLEICNRFTGACLEDFCRLVDCAPCGTLVGGCRGCFDDCDCYRGICDREAGECRDGCRYEKVHLQRDNPQGFASYLVCFEGRIEDPAELAARYDPELECRAAVPADACPPGQHACRGRLEMEPATGRISWDTWSLLCALSRNPLVTRIAGSGQ